jgi:hypothetical protein
MFVPEVSLLGTNLLSEYCLRENETVYLLMRYIIFKIHLLSKMYALKFSSEDSKFVCINKRKLV